MSFTASAQSKRSHKGDLLFPGLETQEQSLPRTLLNRHGDQVVKDPTRENRTPAADPRVRAPAPRGAPRRHSEFESPLRTAPAAPCGEQVTPPSGRRRQGSEITIVSASQRYCEASLTEVRSAPREPVVNVRPTSL